MEAETAKSLSVETHLSNETASATCLKCFALKFSVHNDMKNIYHVEQSITNKCLCFLRNNGSFELVQLERKSHEKAFLPNVRSAKLNNGSHLASTEKLVVAAVNTSLDLTIHSYHDNILECLATIPVKDLIPKEIEFGDSLKAVQVAQFLDELIVLDINDKTILSLQFKDGRFTPLAAIEMPGHHYGNKSFQVIGDVAAVFQIEANKVFLYSLWDGRPLTTLDTGFLDINADSVQTWQISDDLRRLVLVFQSGDLLFIDLDQSVPEWSTLLERDKNGVTQAKDRKTTSSSKSVLQTCQIGDPSWREKLLSLHQKHKFKKKSGLKKGYKMEGSSELKRTEKKSKVTGFRSKDQGLSTVAECKLVHMEAPKELCGYSVEGISIELSTLTLVYAYNDMSVLCSCSIESGSWTLNRFTDGEKVLLAVSPSMPHLVVTETHLLCVLTDQSMDQEHFVSELMVYAGGTVADAVCQINNWGRCSLPIHTLEIGLKHRQVDTVASFLKSKENMFKAGTETPTSTQSSVDSLSWASPYNHYENLIQLEPALHLLLQSARGSMGDKLARVFAKQILDTCMDFLYGLLLDGLGLADSLSEGEEKDDLHKATEKLLEYIEETRKCIRVLEERPRVSRTESVSAGSLSTVSVSNMSIEVSSQKDIYTIQSVENSCEEWTNMDLEAVIEDGILTNRIPELQHYLHDRGESARGDYSNLEKAGVRKAVAYMRDKDIEKAKEILTKLGLDVATKLWEIALHTLDMTLCNFILEELQTLGTLKPDQVAMVTFLRELNSLYPCRNFEYLRDRQHHVKDSASPESLRLKQLTTINPQFDLSEQCANLSSGASEEPGSSEEPIAGTNLGYSEVMLDWVQDWDQKTRDLIKLDNLFYTEGSDLTVFSKETIWEYLQSYNMADVMIDWVNTSFHGNRQQPTKSKWPASHLGAVPTEFVDQLDSCPLYTKWRVLKAFASHGIYDRGTRSSFSEMLQRINETGGILVIPNPLQQCPYVQIDQFHLDLIQYCVEHNLQHLLWSYCSTHRVRPELLQNVSGAYQTDSWLPMFTQFYAPTDEKYYDRHLMYDASVCNAVSVWGKDSSCVGEMIQQGHILAALATLMYSTHQLQQVTFVTQQMEAFDGLPSETVERAVQAFPKLRVTLFPTTVSDSPQLDISVYQLLVGNAPFDPSRLFGWQSTNLIAGEDSPKEMPYFSQAQLVAQYAHSEQLRYTYYLKQGRPSFAFVTFLAEELKSGAQAVSNKRMMVAIGTSLWIGVKNFHHFQISSTCVVFQELLGHDSLLLRTYIQVGSLILSHRNNAVTGPMDKRREMVKQNETEIVELLLNCVQHTKHYGPQVLQTLEAAILESVTRERLSPSKFECGQRWSVAVLFCQLMRLPYTTVFLESCAQTNKWLPFMWFAQMHQYSKEQLQNLLHLFKSPYLQEHLHYVLVNADIRSSEEEEKKKLSKKRSDNAAKDVRSTLYSRIGLSIEKDSDGTSTEEEEQQNILSNDPLDDDSEESQVTYEGSPGDVFGVIFAAQGSKCTWKSLLQYSITLRNPLFAELAASDKEATTVSCLCSWLVSMMDVTEHAQFIENHGKSPWKYNLQTLDAILDIFVKHKWGSILVTGFDIYQQNSALLPFLQFYSEFTERKNFETCKLLLNEFKECIFQFHHEKSVKSADQIGTSDWLESTTYRILSYMLTSSDNVFEVTELLKILDSESITLIFSKEDPDFRKHSQMMQVIQSARIQHVDCAALFSPMSAGYQIECKHITSLIMSQQLFDEARKFATVTETPVDHITLEQIEKQKEKLSGTQLWLSVPARFQFYRECSEKFKKHRVSAVRIAEYFEREATLTENAKQKAFLYELCLSCCQEDNSNEDLDRVMSPALYRKMWRHRIQERVQSMEQSVMEEPAENDMFGDLELTNQKPVSEAKKELACFGKMPHPDDKPKGLSDKEVSALKSLLSELLESGVISECCRVATEFTLYSQDLAIVLSLMKSLVQVTTEISHTFMKDEPLLFDGTPHFTQHWLRTCIRMSLGGLTLEQFEPHMLHLVRTEPGNIHRQSIAAPVPLLRNSSAISLVSNIQPLLDILSEENEEKIFVMERLLKHCEKGVAICRRIITAFKIAAVLGIGYDDVVLGDDYTILRALLKTECSGKFRLAQDFLGTSSLSSAEVAGFLSDAIIQSYRVSLGDAAEDQELFFDPGENFADFHQIVRLCQEPSLLGDRLLSALAAMADSPEQISDKVLTLQTEVLILAHECHTAACNMEGISNILRAARILTSYLESSQEFSLMTRLLTGVGRYNEMIYIFDVLKQNHQFELLLGKGMEKETKLKTAILDYLKRYHPTDTETYTMVALNLMMYREIAQQLENKAIKGLDRLKGKPLENSSEMETALKNITQYFSEAAESYIKDNCLRHAQTCVRKARLVALQLKHLPSNQQFINLTSKGANLLIADHPVFTEAYIVSEAYSKRDNWAAALCKNVILQGDMKYLQEFRSHLRLTPVLVQDAIERYQQLQEKPSQALSNIKKLLPFCKDIKLQYKLARDLGIRELISSLEKGDSKSYIQDFVPTLS